MSGIELLKIIAMTLIVYSHVLPSESGWSPFALNTSRDPLVIILSLMLYGGPLGVQVYTVSTAWFLIDKDIVKPSKAVALLLNSWIISFCFLFLAILLGYDMDVVYVVKQVFPFVFANKWFLNAYFMLYIFKSNYSLIGKNNKTYLLRMIMLFILYGCISFIDSEAVL